MLCLGGIAALFGLPAILKGVREVDFHAAKADELVRALRAGEVEKAYRCTDDEFRAKVSPERFRAVLKEIPFRQATDHSVRFEGETSTRAGRATAILEVSQRPLEISFDLYRPVTGMDFLVCRIHVGGRSLFAAELGDQRDRPPPNDAK
ncbi:MAG: hypothetical protein M0R80_09395 [Proteobacteria bacterium]|nr:hypothetical protein [Pseudomonadota bacterium]